MTRRVHSFDWDRFAAVADVIAPRFSERTAALAPVPASILFSDGFCVCALCEMLGVEYLVEAGTGFGGSTEMFARYFAGAGPVKHIWSIDQAVNPRWQRPLGMLRIKRYGRGVWSTEKQAKRIARARLAPFANVDLMYGDACVKAPRLVTKLAARPARIGVVIDGPKGDEQLRLAEQLLDSSPNVAFAALDDVGPMFEVEGRHSRFMASAFAAFATSDRQFFDRYSWINAGRLPARMIGKPEHTGYGLGVMLNRGEPGNEGSLSR
jgi:hypothetical protein